jgi:hypothetical protein
MKQEIKIAASQTKAIEYAYPTSSFANRNGFGVTGCWYVAIYNKLNDHKAAEYKAISDDKASVLKVFLGVDLPTNEFRSLRNISL